ncbi:MAG TPA: ribulose-phosphate 3-epimerase [Agriterribacter sp.]|nr:ribulose-phosphate 3-epimerase [Agriterribacter sp.]HRQ50660.1 ribulose-phosphate 3-epimerase [Agriterribacter sp.]
MPIVSPSLLACDFLKLQEACDMLNESEADWFHLDIMDGRFVPNISFGMPLVEKIRKATHKPCDVHLMIEEPGRYAADFKIAGADHLIVHYEACPHLHRNIQQIKDLGMKAGIAINPHTPVQLLQDILADTDIICMMSVNPGFGGQAFIAHTLTKIQMLRQRIDQLKLDTIIEVDGGITLNNAAAVVEAGAHALVAGTTIFNAPDPKAAIHRLKHI